MPGMRLLPILLLLTLPALPQTTERGEINGAQFLIEMPAQWNGTLLVYCHGYSGSPGRFAEGKPSPMAALTQTGAALIMSGYSAGGWAVEEAVNDTQALVRHFIAKHGKPRQTYVFGHSMGGFLTMTLLEQFPTTYDGGLALCGPLAPASWFMSRHVLDYRVVFDYFFPGALPGPAIVPPEWSGGAPETARIMALLDQNDAKASEVRRFTSMKNNKDLAGTLVFFTAIMQELNKRTGGNPFGNRSTVYQGTSDDNALNDGVKRYSADPRAAEYIHKFYTPTGRLTRPMLAIHTTYDPLIPAAVPNYYADLSARAGSAHLFHQRYVKADGHCTIPVPDIVKGLQDLQGWARDGRRPD
jgi:pimeloyl-ACP methyl ester carboxylesterase